MLYLNAGPGSEYFTIRIHHSGKFVELNHRCYVGGKVDYFDYCHQDEMSMLELNEMAKELGLTDILNFFHNRGVMNDCNYIDKMKSDIDTMFLDNFLDDFRVTEIFVEHEYLDESESVQNEDEDTDHLPHVYEPLGYVGDDDEPQHDRDDDGGDSRTEPLGDGGYGTETLGGGGSGTETLSG